MERLRPCSKLTGHVVICNVNEKVRAVVEQLWCVPAARPLDVVLIVQDEDLWRKHPDWHPRASAEGRLVTLVGCPAEGEVLREARIGDAHAAVILADPNQGSLADARSGLVGIAIEHENPRVHTVMELNLSVNRGHLRATEVDEVICLGEIAEKLVAQSCISPGISRLFAHLLTTEASTSQLFVPSLPAELEGRSYRDIARSVIRAREPYVLCGFICGGDGEDRAERRRRTIALNPRADREPGKDTVLGSGDQLIVLASSPPDLTRLAATTE